MHHRIIIYRTIALPVICVACCFQYKPCLSARWSNLSHLKFIQSFLRWMNCMIFLFFLCCFIIKQRRRLQWDHIYISCCCHFIFPFISFCHYSYIIINKKLQMIRWIESFFISINVTCFAFISRCCIRKEICFYFLFPLGIFI